MSTRTSFRSLVIAAFTTLSSFTALAQAPAITTQPASASVAAGTTANFTVVATGAAPLTYAWFKEARLVSFGANAALTITSANPGDVGSYRVVVSNATGSAISNSVTLTVTGLGGGTPPGMVP